MAKAEMQMQIQISRNVLREIIRAVRCEKDHCRIEEDEGAFTYAYKQGFHAAIKYIENDIDIIVKEMLRNGYVFMVSRDEAVELADTLRGIKETKEAFDPDAPGYIKACKELAASLKDLTGWRIYGTP